MDVWDSFTMWNPRYVEIRISVLGMTMALWLGLFLLRRAVGTPVALLGACTLLLLALFYAFEAALGTPRITAGQYELLLRTQGLIVPLSISGWVSLSFLIRSQKRITGNLKFIWLAVAFIGVSQALLRALTNWQLDYSNIQPSPSSLQDWWAPRGPGYGPYVALATLGLMWSMYNILRPFRGEAKSFRGLPRGKGFWPLFAGALLLSASATYVMVNSAQSAELPRMIGLAVLTVAVIALGLSVFRYNSLVEDGRDITTDFLHSLAGVGTVLLLYAVILYLIVGFHRWDTGSMIAVIASLVITHSLPDAACRLFDRVLERMGLSHWTARSRLRRELWRRVRQLAESQDALKERLRMLLSQLCQEVATNRGYVALSEGDLFVVQATYGTSPSVSRFASPDLLSEAICAVCGSDGVELRGMGLIVPLWTRGRQAGVVVLGEKHYDDCDISRVIVHAEAMQRAIEERETAEEIGRLERKLERLQRQQQRGIAGADDKKLLAICAGSGLGFRNAAEVVSAATDMLENYMDDPYALESSPFLLCTRVQAKVGRSHDQSQAVAILEGEISSTIAAMKPSRPQGYDWRRWTYLYHRYIERYDQTGRRITMREIGKITGVSRKTLTRHHEKAIRDFVTAFLSPERKGAAN